MNGIRKQPDVVASCARARFDLSSAGVDPLVYTAFEQSSFSRADTSRIWDLNRYSSVFCLSLSHRALWLEWIRATNIKRENRDESELGRLLCVARRPAL